MGVKHYNLARMSTATGGTGTMTLMAAVTGFLSFASAGVQDGDYITYAIEEGNNREVGRGTYTASGSTLTRDTILASTAGIGTPITLTGNAQVYITIAAEDLGGVSVGVPSAPPAAGQSQLYSLVSATPKNVTNWGMSSATFASSSSYNSGVPPIRVFNAVVDASHSAGWLTANTTTGWIQVQLIAPAVITGYAVMGWSVDTFPGRCPKNWTLQGSNNGVDWTVLDTQTNQTTWTIWTCNTYTVSGVSTAYSYYKLVVTANNGDGGYLGLSQFKLLSGSNILPPPYQATASSTNDANSRAALNAFSPTPQVNGSAWLTASTATGWIQLQLPAPVLIARYELMGYSPDTFPGRCPRDWTLQGSNNGVDWTVLDTQTNQTTWTLWTRNTYALTGVTTAYSYYKLVVTANNGDSYLGLSQFRLLSATPIRGNPVVLCVEDQYGDSTVIGL